MKRTLRGFGLLLTAAMLIQSTAFAGELIGQTNFDEGIAYPWQVVEENAGELDYTVEDGRLNIEIVNPGGANRGGVDRWDCKLVHDGLTIQPGNTYIITYTIFSDVAGKYYTCIKNKTGEAVGGAIAGEVWHNNIGEVTIISDQRGTIKSNECVEYGTGWSLQDIQAGETLTVTAVFSVSDTIEDAQWEFQFGGNGLYGNGSGQDCFPKGTTLSFDNMSLENYSSDDHDFTSNTNYQAVKILSVSNAAADIFSPTQRNSALIFAAYNANGRLEKIDVQDNVTIQAGAHKYNANTSFTNIDGLNIKVFLWDSIESLRPLCATN